MEQSFHPPLAAAERAALRASAPHSGSNPCRHWTEVLDYFVAGQRGGTGFRLRQMILGLMEPSGLIEQGGPLVWVLLGLGFIGAVCVVVKLFRTHSEPR